MTRTLNLHYVSLTLAAGVLSLAGSMAHAQYSVGDREISGSLCVGIDCVNNENFGFDTIRLKENNLRIRAVDTSSTASFPTNDWQLTFNDSSNGGANKFSIEDIDGGRTPFTIEAGTPNNALYVDSSGSGGRIGFGTSAPVTDLHVKSGNTPTLRLEQDGTSGFATRTWDVAGNEANFFIRDATGGSALPFRIFPGAPSNALTIAANGDVGLGTASPGANLHVVASDDVQLRVEETGAGFAQLIDLINNGAPRIQWDNSATAGGVWQIGLADPGDNFLIRDQSGSQNSFSLAAGGNLTILGTLTENSDKNRKMAIIPVDSEEILKKVSMLPVAAWTYKQDAEEGIRHIGPMAQDFYALFGTGASETGISTIDTSGVALAAIQALTAQNEELLQRLEMLEKKVVD